MQFCTEKQAGIPPLSRVGWIRVPWVPSRPVNRNAGRSPAGSDWQSRPPHQERTANPLAPTVGEPSAGPGSFASSRSARV